MPTYVNDTGCESVPFTLTTRGTVSGTAGFLSVRAGDFTVIWVFVADTSEPGTPPKVTTMLTFAPVPNLPPRIVIRSPPAHEPVVGEKEEMNGPVSGTPTN